jgi:hypothetical protein
MAYMPSAMQNTPVPLNHNQPAPEGWRGLLKNQDLAMALLANSGYSPQKRSFGEIVGTSMMQANQMKQGREDDAFKRQYMQAQMQAMGRNAQSSPFGAVQPDKFTPESLAKFEKTGKHSDLVLRSTGIMYGRYNPGDFTPESWASFVESGDPASLQRYVAPANPSVQTVGGVPTVIQPSRLGGKPLSQPLSTLSNEIGAAAALKGAEAQAGAVGAGQGATIADIQKKGVDAQQMLGAIQMADGLLDKSTGSWVGSMIDKGAAAFGKSTEGAKAGASLKVLQASLLSFVPKMSGPQSDSDRLIYIQAVGEIGDTNVPGSTRKAALKTVLDMQKSYIDKANAPVRLGPDSKTPTQLDQETEALLRKYGGG